MRSAENQTVGVGSRTPILLMTPSLMIQWKLHRRSRKQKRKNKPTTIFDSKHCDWLVLSLLLPTPTFPKNVFLSITWEPIVPSSESRAEQFSSVGAIWEHVFLSTTWEPIVPSSESRAEQTGP